LRLRLGTYYRWLLSESLGLLPESHERVLDVGCHDGYFLSHIPGCLKVAVDLEPDRAGHYPVWPSDGRRLPLADETFDRIYLLDVLEHVVDYGALLAEALRVLRPGGTLWISTPSLYWWVVPPFLTSLLDRQWGHVRRGHTVQDICEHLPAACQVTPTMWNMPYFRTFYFPVRLLWSLWPVLARRWLAWVARQDRRSPPGRHGFLFIRVIKGGSQRATKDW
jgi:SAM-dependent methyltransferase